MNNILNSWFKKSDDRFYKFHKMMMQSFSDQSWFYDSKYKTRVALREVSIWDGDFMNSRYEFVAIGKIGIRQGYYPNKVILNIFEARFRIKPIITCK